ERDGGEKGAVGLGQSLWGRRRRGRRDRQRRNANALARNKPGACLGAAAVDPDLAGAEQLLEAAMGRAAKWLRNQRSRRMPSSPASTVRVSTGDLCDIAPQADGVVGKRQETLIPAHSGLHLA